MRKLREISFFQKFFVPNKLIQTNLRPIRWKLYRKEDKYSEEVVEIVFFYYHIHTLLKITHILGNVWEAIFQVFLELQERFG